MKTIRIHEDFITHKPVGGNPLYNADVAAYAQNLHNWGCKSKRVGNMIESSLPTNIPFDIADFTLIVKTLGGSVEGYRAIIKLPVSNLDDITPTYLPNRTVKNWDNTDPENPVALSDTFKTWREWRGVRNSYSGLESYPLYVVEDFVYIHTQASGKDLSNSQLLSLIDDFEVVDSIPQTEQPAI